MSIPIKGSDSNTYYTNTEKDAAGQETQVVSGISDWLFRRLFRAMGRLTYDTSNQLRVIPATHAVTVSSGTVTTVTTCTTANVGMGDSGKPATGIVFNRQLIASGFKRNLVRS